MIYQMIFKISHFFVVNRQIAPKSAKLSVMFRIFQENPEISQKFWTFFSVRQKIIWFTQKIIWFTGQIIWFTKYQMIFWMNQMTSVVVRLPAATESALKEESNRGTLKRYQVF